jgi:hypothetical protein
MASKQPPRLQNVVLNVVALFADSAGLTADGTLLVGGCDACNGGSLISAGDWWSPTMTGSVSIPWYFPQSHSVPWLLI